MKYAASQLYLQGENKAKKILVTLEFGSYTSSLISAPIFVSGIQVFCFLGSIVDFLLFIIAILFSSIHQLSIASVLPSS